MEVYGNFDRLWSNSFALLTESEKLMVNHSIVEVRINFHHNTAIPESGARFSVFRFSFLWNRTLHWKRGGDSRENTQFLVFPSQSKSSGRQLASRSSINSTIGVPTMVMVMVCQ